MAKLYVANCCRQTVHFIFRLPENTRLFTKDIKPGQQALVHEGLTEDVDKIIRDHSMYGLTRVDQIDRKKPFVGTCYQIDKEITVDQINKALMHNEDVLEALGLEHRKQAAVVAADTVDRQAGQISTVFESTVSEVPRPNEQSSGKLLSETLGVAKARGKR